MIKKSMIGLCIAVACMSASIFSLSGCEPHEGSEDQLKADVDSFANYYFNWHFPKAVKYCTQESERWLRYAASNVNVIWQCVVAWFAAFVVYMIGGIL